MITLTRKTMVEQSFKALHTVSKRLRKECPWDNQETIASFAKYLKEEADEVLETIEKNDYFELHEELGDLLWNILFITNIAEENGFFNLKEVLENTKEKMIRRHPHVYGNASKDLGSIAKLWKEIKEQEKQMKEERRKKFDEKIRINNQKMKENEQ